MSEEGCMKATPGPWEYWPLLSGSENDRGFRVSAKDNRGGGYTWIADVSPVIDNERGDASEEGKANARLIAAAPELLEALKSIENDDGSIPDAIWALRNAAIKKAESE